MKEKNITLKFKRDKEEANNVKEVLKKLNDEEETKFEEEIEEIQRMRRYEEGKTRPLKLRLKSQAVTRNFGQRIYIKKS